MVQGAISWSNEANVIIQIWLHIGIVFAALDLSGKTYQSPCAVVLNLNRYTPFGWQALGLVLPIS